MNTKKFQLTIFLATIITGLIISPALYSQGGTAEGGASYLSKQQRTVIIDSILSGDLSRIRNLARRQPTLAPPIAALHAKHSGAKGSAAGAIAASILTAIDANVDEASSVGAAVGQSTTSSLEEIGEIAMEIINALGLSNDLENTALFLGSLANKLGLRGEQAGAFAAIMIKKLGYRGYEAGKVAGVIAREGDFTGEETEQLVAEVLNALNPDPEEADKIASTVELETGEKVVVQLDTGAPEAQRAKAALPQETPLSPLDELINESLDKDTALDAVESPILTLIGT